MSIQPPGTALDYTVTWLEMAHRPNFDYPHQPGKLPVSLLEADTPPVWYFLALYDAVGRDYAWEDMHQQEEGALADWLADEQVKLFTAMGSGWPQGFFMLDMRRAGICDLAYFGIVPESVGTGLGRWLLKTAILMGWDMPGTEKLTVNTCTLDHPRALAMYQRYGFEPVRREDRHRVLTRPRDLSRIPE